jgi:hypothetical protein
MGCSLVGDWLSCNFHEPAKNPFPSKPPRYLRAMVYQYHITENKISAKHVVKT